MGKKGKKQQDSLGRALIKSRFKSRNVPRNGSMLHTADINDGYDWGRLNLQSVTEESSFEEFLSTAELAGTEFQAEKLNIKFVNPKSIIGLLSKDEKERMLRSQEKNKDLLKIPRRPKWDISTTAEELESREKETFLEWRRQLAHLQEVEGLVLTPFEKNLEFWRQLWRVLERSDVIVQIVDARNPLLFRCEDLERYVKEIDAKKLNMILINKADFLTQEQREAWAKYFSDINLRVAFFSATLATEKVKNTEKEDEKSTVDESESDVEESSDEEEEKSESLYTSKSMSDSEYESANESFNDDNSCTTSNVKVENGEEVNAEERALERLKISPADSEPEGNTGRTETLVSSEHGTEKKVVNSAELLDRDGLINLLKSYKACANGVTTIGMVGYPNVGKSSTINALLMNKKVSVSAMPGKTKHYQTLYLDKDLVLCDCPGLVMPSFVFTKGEMILNGILPIDRMRDHVPAITLLATWIPRHIFEDVYGLILPLPMEGEDPDRPLIAEELLNAHGYNRGFMTQNGQPDNSRSAKYILKDFVSGKLLYCFAPPTITQKLFHKFPPRRRNISANRHIPPRAIRVNERIRVTSGDLDREFFQNKTSGVHIKGISGRQHPLQSLPTGAESTAGSTQSLSKPWKMINKHANKKKREKTRRMYAHLDRH